MGRREANVDEPVDISTLKRVSDCTGKNCLSLRAAADCDVPFNTLARVEKGHLPDLANFRRIVIWLGLAPEQFFQPPRVRTENTPEIIAHHLSRDPNLSDSAASQIAGLVRDLYSNLARPPAPCRSGCAQPRPSSPKHPGCSEGSSTPCRAAYCWQPLIKRQVRRRATRIQSRSRGSLNAPGPRWACVRTRRWISAIWPATST